MKLSALENEIGMLVSSLPSGHRSGTTFALKKVKKLFDEYRAAQSAYSINSQMINAQAELAAYRAQVCMGIKKPDPLEEAELVKAAMDQDHTKIHCLIEPSSPNSAWKINEISCQPNETALYMTDNLDLRSAINQTIEYLEDSKNEATRAMLKKQLERLLDVEFERAISLQVVSVATPGDE